jgi:hypothetical protein
MLSGQYAVRYAGHDGDVAEVRSGWNSFLWIAGRLQGALEAGGGQYACTGCRACSDDIRRCVRVCSILFWQLLKNR